jgi:putative endonuclease
MARAPDLAPSPYWLYLLECEGGRYYAGIARDVEQRFYQHVLGVGAKFTRAFQPLRVLAWRRYASRSSALRAELQLKKLPRARKLAYFAASAASAASMKKRPRADPEASRGEAPLARELSSPIAQRR